MSRASLESYEEKPRQDSSAATTIDGDDRVHDARSKVPTAIPEDTTAPSDGAPLESAISYQSVPAQPSIPNGGTIAWLQVLSGFFMFFNSW